MIIRNYLNVSKKKIACKYIPQLILNIDIPTIKYFTLEKVCLHKVPNRSKNLY